MTKSRITLLHVEDDPLWQTTVAGVLRGWSEVEQCDCVGTASAAKACAAKLEPQIVLLDVVLPDGDGLQLARELAMQPWQPKLLVLTVRRDDVVLQSASAAHIDGLLWKSTDVGAQLPEALRCVAAGAKYFPTEVRAALRKFRTDPRAYFKILSDRELELLPLFGGGSSDDEIAATLGISAHTVKSHRHSILTKLNLPSTPRLIHWAIQRGFVRFPSDGWVVREDRGARQAIPFILSFESREFARAGIRAGSASVPSTPSVPLALAAHTVESLHAEHGRPRRVIYWILLVAVLVAIACLPLIEVDVSVGAPGIIRPATERVELRLPLGGRIARVWVRDNESVAVGQSLLELATPDLDERLARNAELQREKSAMLALLETISATSATESLVLPLLRSGEAGDVFAGVRALHQEVAQLNAQLDANRLTEARASVELARATAMAEKGIATQRELDDARYSLERVQAEARLMIEQARTRWQLRREEEARALAMIISETRRIEAEREQAIVRAPVAGTVHGFVGVGEGAFVSAGQIVGTVSPDDRLLIETFVSSRAIGLVHREQPVRMQIDAFPYTHWGTLDGRVVAIAADASNASVGGGGPPFFKVTIEPAHPQMTLSNGTVGALGKGMTLSARFVTARRTLLQILYQDASEWLDPRSRSAAQGAGMTTSR